MNENKSPKVCPLLKQHCFESSCAWYMQGLPPLRSAGAG